LGHYGNIATRDYYPQDSTNWFKPGVKYDRGSRTPRFTMRSYFPWSCGNPKVALLDPPGWPVARIRPMNPVPAKIIVLTDGTCGSACALFTTKMMVTKKATVVGYGGLPFSQGNSERMESASFAGGNVFGYSEVIDQLDTLSMRDTQPQMHKLITSAYTRFNSHEMYARVDSALPREFDKMEVQYQLPDYEAFLDAAPLKRDGEPSRGLRLLYTRVNRLFLLNVPAGRPAERLPWQPPSQNPMTPIRLLWVYLLAAIGVVLLITTAILAVLQYRRVTKKKRSETAPVTRKNLLDDPSEDD